MMITPDAHDRMIAHTLHAQLTEHRRKLIGELGKPNDRRKEQRPVQIERRKDGVS